ncbi:TPA: hypothetical protein ACITN2_004335 [Salmonella enterica subsp. enterica serovar Virchow]
MDEHILEAKARQLTGEINARRIRECGGKGWNANQRKKAAGFITALVRAAQENKRIAATIGQLESAAKMSGAHAVAMYIIRELEAMKLIAWDVEHVQCNSYLNGHGMFITENFKAFLLSPLPRVNRNQ